MLITPIKNIKNIFNSLYFNMFYKNIKLQLSCLFNVYNYIFNFYKSI